MDSGRSITSVGKRGVRGCGLLLLPLLFAGPARAQRAESSAQPLASQVVELTLSNGWRFLLLPRGGAPTVSFETYADCGAVHDPEELEGLTNLVKNLLFKGSARLGTRDWEAERGALEEVDRAHAELLAAKRAEDAEALSRAEVRLRSARERAATWVVSEEFSRVLEDAGGGPTLNAFTDGDGTRFVVSLPSNHVETWCWMESERFRAPVFREFFSERDALLEDRRGRLEADELANLDLALRETAFAGHPLGRSALGSPDSLARIDRATATAYFLRQFGARRLTTAIVGNFDPTRLAPRLEAYFGSVPAGAAELPAPPPVPPQAGERRVLLSTEGRPVLAMAWRVPPAGHPDRVAVEVAVRLLGYARSSRLERRLRREQGLVTELVTSPAWGADRFGSLAMIRAVPNVGVGEEAVEAAIHEEIALLQRLGPSLEELSGVRRVATADHLRSLRDNAAIAAGLCAAQVEEGDWRRFFGAGARVERVSAEDVQRVLGTYFVPERRTVAILEGREGR